MARRTDAGGYENSSKSRTESVAEFPYHRCRNSNSSSLIKIKETSGGAQGGVRRAPRSAPLSYLSHNSVRLWALCTLLSRRSAYAPLSAPLTQHFFLFLFRGTREREMDRVIFRGNVFEPLLSWALTFFPSSCSSSRPNGTPATRILGHVFGANGCQMLTGWC